MQDPTARSPTSLCLGTKNDTCDSMTVNIWARQSAYLVSCVAARESISHQVTEDLIVCWDISCFHGVAQGCTQDWCL